MNEQEKETKTEITTEDLDALRVVLQSVKGISAVSSVPYDIPDESLDK